MSEKRWLAIAAFVIVTGSAVVVEACVRFNREIDFCDDQSSGSYIEDKEARLKFCRDTFGRELPQ